MVVDGDMQRLETRMLAQAAAATIATQRDLGEARQALDVKVEQIAGSWVFVAADRRGWMQVAPA